MHATLLLASVVYLQPLGSGLPEEDVAAVSQALSAFYPVEVRVLPRVDLPRQTYYPPRRRYRADRLLDFLASRKPADALRVLGLTAADISTSKGRIEDWGVMGLASLDGSAAVISTLRCQRRSAGPAQTRVRLARPRSTRSDTRWAYRTAPRAAASWRMPPGRCSPATRSTICAKRASHACAAPATPRTSGETSPGRGLDAPCQGFG
jgi:hypothetical protein